GAVFTKLARLELDRCELGGDEGAKQLAKVKCPNLTALGIVGDQASRALDEEIETLARSPLFGRLTALEASHGRITETGIKAIAVSPSSKSLRYLNVG